MSTVTSIQTRRIVEKISAYYERFGYRTRSVIKGNQASVTGTKNLGPDQFECRVAETAKGTAIGFFAKNYWYNFLPLLPFLVFAVLYGLTQVEAIAPHITGANTLFGINYLKLLVGDLDLSILSVLVFLMIPTVFIVMNYTKQKIRLANLKLRFPFFTKDANWEPNDLSTSTISFQAVQFGFFQGWVLAILYFAVLAMSTETIDNIVGLYDTDINTLRIALHEGFSLTGGALIGLISADKAYQIRKELKANDISLNLRGGLSERRLEPVIYSISVSGISALFSILFFSVTFLKGTTITNLAYMVITYVIAGIISAYIRDEGPLWFSISFGSILLFSSLSFVFRTGSESALAFVVVMQLLLIPMSFILISGHVFSTVLERYRIKTLDPLYTIFPHAAFISIFLHKRRVKKAKIRYESSLESDELDFVDEKGLIFLDKQLLAKKGEKVLFLARHYFELITWYNAQFEKDFVLLPRPHEFQRYLQSKVQIGNVAQQIKFLEFADQVIWDVDYIPESEELAQNESFGKEMVLAIN